MITNTWLQLCATWAMVYLLSLMFIVVGKIVLRKTAVEETPSENWCTFNCLLVGLFAVTSLYAIAVARGATVCLLVPPLIHFGFLHQRSKTLAILHHRKIVGLPYGSLAIVALLSVVVLFVFPETEYKQADAFFYLKIAESLNATGQENISHYHNSLSAAFHGMEPYHHFEIWITAFIIRFTSDFLPSILIHRGVVQALLLVGIVLALFGLFERLNKKPVSVAQQVFCWALLFILPNLLPYFPKLYHVFISDFEGNLLERPNFRIIYILLIPAVAHLALKKSINRYFVCLLLLLCVVTFKCTMVVLPALLFYGTITYLRKQPSYRLLWSATLVFSVAFALMYLLFSVRQLPAIYGIETGSFLVETLSKFKFIAYSITTSVLYIIALVFISCLPLFIWQRKRTIAVAMSLGNALLIFVIIGLVGLISARVLFLKDNAYQFLFIAHIVATIFIWLVYLFVLRDVKRPGAYWLSATLFISTFIIRFLLNDSQVIIYAQNGKYVYAGKQYSVGYLQRVDRFFAMHRGVIGGYMADRNFYAALYYSRRNPNVYFLPLTYIVAARHNQNIELCLSDSSAIMAQVNEAVATTYLNNAMVRSLFQRYQQVHNTGNYQSAVRQFITDYRIAYLIVTKDVDASFIRDMVKAEWSDTETGERFLVL